MDSKIFKRKLIGKLVVSGVFGVLAVSSLIAISQVNENVIKPNEGFITNALCEVDTGGQKNSSGEKLAVEIEQEGIVLAKNDNNCLPLSKTNKKVNVFGYDAIQWIISNSGSGSAGAGSSQKTWGLLDALEDKGIEYNKSVIDYYKKWADPVDHGLLSYNSSYDKIYRLANPSLSNDADYAQVYEDAKEADINTAIVVIGRWGGEHLDPPHQQINNYKSKKSKNPDRGYLEITEEEEELLTAVGQDYENVVVVINSTNTMQMDFMTTIDGLDSCILVGPTGTVGAKAIPQVLYGDINPSGRTVDTWPMNHRYNVAYYTNGYWPNETGTYYTNVPNGANLANKIDTANFADYYEGIYVGYKWFETADAEGFWDNSTYNGYENVVAFPFGHGLSYTSFSWELMGSNPTNGSAISENQDVTFQVKVTNTGSVAGRDVVEAYLTAQYYKGEIEKSSVKLVAFQKTKNLMPGESEIVTLTARTRDFLQFDCYDANKNGHAGYELDRGSYKVRFMSDAHNEKADASVTFNVKNTINVDEDPETGAEVKPLFTGEDAIDGVSCDGKTIGENIEYLTREEFAPLMTSINPCRPWNKGLETCDDSSKPTAYSTNMAKEWDSATVDVFGNATPTESVTFGANNGLKVLDSNRQLTELGIDLAMDYDDPQWDDVLDQVTWEECGKIAAGQSYSRPGILSVGLRDNSNCYHDAEGASQVGGSLDGGRKCTAYPTPTVQAQSWNENILYAFGLSEAKDMSLTNNDYLYGPASNIHRNPYGGRHSEYHSEDGFLAGRCLANVTKGLSDGGKNGFIKHFALNDTEYHRVGLFTWTTEQAMRELYLRPFEESVKYGEATALMSSFNRIGAIWTGGSQALIQGVLRNEWGFKGMTITDYTENGTLQDANQMVRSGGNFILASSNYSHPSLANATPRFQWRMRESAKQVIYGNLRTQYCNYRYNLDDSNKAIVNTSSKSPWVWWKPTLYSLEGSLAALLWMGFILPLIPSNPEFRAHLFGKKKEEANENE